MQAFLNSMQYSHNPLRILSVNLISLCLLFSSIVINADTVTDVYSSQHAPANQLQRSIKKTYPEAIISNQGSQLIIRAEKHQLQEILELLPLLDKPSQEFIVLFSTSQQSPQSKTISTRTSKVAEKQFKVSDGETLTIDYHVEAQQLTSLSRFHKSLEMVETDKDSISLTVQAVAEQMISISYRHYRLSNGERKTLQNSAQINLGSWFALNGEQVSNGNTKHYGKPADDGLYIKVVRANH